MTYDIINALRLSSDRVKKFVGTPNILDEAAEELQKLIGMLEVANEMAEHYAQERDAEKADADRLARRNALLVAEIETVRAERAEAAIQIVKMMDEIEAWQQSMRKAERDMAELRAERDEARIELCERDAAERTKSAWSSGLSMRYLWQDIARERGWDCLKDKP